MFCKLGGDTGAGVMGRMGWDVSHSTKLRDALENMGIEIHKDLSMFFLTLSWIQKGGW